MKRLLFTSALVSLSSHSPRWMQRPSVRLLLPLGLAALSACSFAPPWPPMPMPDTMTRQEIEHYRGREQERLQTALRECYQRFAVNDCRREALTRHNEVLHQLRAQELRLNALEREARQRKLQADPPNARPGAEGSASGSGTRP